MIQQIFAWIDYTPQGAIVAGLVLAVLVAMGWLWLATKGRP